MKKYLVAAATTALLATGASAEHIDLFDANAQCVNQNGTGDVKGTACQALTSTVPSNSTDGTRTLTISNITLGAGSDFDPYAFVDTTGSGVFGINNGTGDDATVTIDYSLVTRSSIGSIEVDFLNNDNAIPTDSTLQLFVGALDEGTQFLPGGPNFTISFSLSDAATALLAAGTSLSFVFNGSPDYDLSVDAIYARVPEPGALGLLGLGLLGMGVAARRRKAA